MKIKRNWLAILLAPTLFFSAIPPASAQSQAPTTVLQPITDKEASKTNGEIEKNKNKGKRVENLVDPKATKATRSLFAYLEDIRGKHVLFGHQHTTDEGLTLTGSSIELESDVKNSTGDFPAVFGWDTLSLEGKEKPGVKDNPSQSRIELSKSMKKAHDSGGIVSLSTHLPNFVTGGTFNDTSGSVVEHILPGGYKNGEFNAFLDNLALFANHLKDDKGELIPVLFRPFHEQNGGWFWWGAKTTTPSQYIEIYRYTVEYLRDKKGVNNFLYVYSPNGTFNGNKDNYLATYPGDDYIDILGMDQYDNQSNPGSTLFLNNLVGDLAMISKLADEKGKIATFSEFGYSPQGMKTSGNGDLKWFTKVMDAIKADPDARRIAYMQTWANFALNGNLFVPYRNAPNGLGDHELLPDFIDFYNDPYTSFLQEVKGVYNNKVKTEKEQPFMHVVTPTANSILTKEVTKIRTKVLNDKPKKVVYTVEGSNTEIPMKMDTDGYYSANWSPPARMNGKTANITVKSYTKNNKIQKQTVKVNVKISEMLLKKYTFNSDISDIENKGAYPEYIRTKFKHKVLQSDGKLQINLSGLKSNDDWQEIKISLPKITQQTNITDVNRVKFDVLVPASAVNRNKNATLRGMISLPPDQDTKYGITTTEKKLTDLEIVKIKGQEFLEFPVSIDVNDPTKLSEAKSLALSIIGTGLEFNEPMYVDNIKLLNTYTEMVNKPELVDDFETYLGDDAALTAKFVHAGGDTTIVSLDEYHKKSGAYAMKFEYTLGGNGYTGVTKVLGGVDWSTSNKLKFWLVPDGKNQKMVIQIKVDGVTYEAYPSLASTTPEWIEIPFDEFTVASWDTANIGKKISKENLKNVQEFSIYVNALVGATLTSTLYFDDISAVDN